MPICDRKLPSNAVFIDTNSTNTNCHTFLTRSCKPWYMNIGVSLHKMSYIPINVIDKLKTPITRSWSCSYSSNRPKQLFWSRSNTDTETNNWPFKICNHFSRKVVLEKWFCKLGFFFLVNTFSWTRKKIRVCRTTFLQPEKRWIYNINPSFFLVNHFSRTRKKIRVFRTTFLKPDFSNQISQTRFLEPLFYTFLESGCRLNGWMANTSQNYSSKRIFYR